MLYVVTTTAFEDGPAIGVFTEYEFAISAIQEYVEKHEGLGQLEGKEYAYCAFDEWDERYVYFYIEICYPNIPLA